MMKRRLIVMRHAKSDWKIPGVADHDRPLNERGRRTAPLIAKLLIDHEVVPDVVLASTATRVRQTLQPLLDLLNPEPKVIFDGGLYLASRNSLLKQINGLDEAWKQVMLVGHNPGLSELVSYLFGQPIELPTAAVAVCDCQADSWSSAVTQNRWSKSHLWIPKEILET
jgi:phosphohistidine phosphatase